MLQGHINSKFCLTSTLCGPLGKPHGVPRGSPVPPTWVVTGSEDGRVFVYDLDTQQVCPGILRRSREGAWGCT